MEQQAELDRVRQLVIDSAKEWRAAECSTPARYAVAAQTVGAVPAREWCFGDNHQPDCAVELKRQDLIAALNKLDMVDVAPAGRTQVP